MLDPESNIAEQLANAIRHHQKRLVEQDEAEKKAFVYLKEHARVYISGTTGRCDVR